MKVQKLPKLARSENPTLVYLCRKWMSTQKCGNPVSGAIALQKFKYTCDAVAAAVVGLFALSMLFIPAALMGLLVAVFGCLTLFCLFRRERVSFKNARQFCEAITILEKAIGPLNCHISGTKWDIGYDPIEDGLTLISGHLTQEGQKLLRDETKKIMELQSIPWREKEAKALRDKFAHRVTLLHALLGVSLEVGPYFKAAS